jgi:LemA protein
VTQQSRLEWVADAVYLGTVPCMTVLIALVLMFTAVAVFSVVLYNSLVRLRNQVDNGWAQIDVQLKRRADLIPNLVETVKGYAAHESETLEAVIAARNAGLSAHTPAEATAAEGPIVQALGKLFALQEAYPNLKADVNFRQLQEELTATEDRVAYARQFYNDSVMRYHVKIETFPSVIVAKLGSFNRRELFEAPPEARNAPTVSF